MNQAQRKFLITKIQENCKAKLDAYRRSIPEYPDLQNYIYMMIMQDKYEIQPPEVIKAAMRRKALSAKDRAYNWLAEERSWGDFAAKRKVTLNITDLLILPPEYEEEMEKHRIARKIIEDKMAELQSQTDGLITRIQLASDKTLETMIAEVDDLGDISLYDKSLKALMGWKEVPNESKKITEG